MFLKLPLGSHLQAGRSFVVFVVNGSNENAFARFVGESVYWCLSVFTQELKCLLVAVYSHVCVSVSI